MSNNGTQQQATSNPDLSRDREWEPGEFYVPGQPVPKGAQVVSWDNGTMTLERVADKDFDPELVRKLRQALDEEYQALLKPTDNHPDGRKPTKLLVNENFRYWIPKYPKWGETAEIVVERDDRRLTGNHSREVGSGQWKVRFKFVCEDELE